jgi:hypothetical protein
MENYLEQKVEEARGELADALELAPRAGDGSTDRARMAAEQIQYWANELDWREACAVKPVEPTDLWRTTDTGKSVHLIGELPYGLFVRQLPDGTKFCDACQSDACGHALAVAARR